MAAPKEENNYRKARSSAKLPLFHVQLHTGQPDLRHAVVCDDVRQLKIDSIGSDYIPGAAPPLRLVDVDGAVIRRCTAPSAADPFLLLEGERTRHIVLQQNDLEKAARAVVLGAGVSEQALSSSD